MNTLHTLDPEDAISLICDSTWAFGTVDKSGRFDWVNQAYCDVLNAPPDLVIGTHFEQWTHEDDIDIDKELAAKVATGELPGYTLAKRYVQRGSTPVQPRVVWGLLTVSGKWEATKFVGYRVQYQPYNHFREAGQANRAVQWKAIADWVLENWKTILLIAAASTSLIYGGSEKLLSVLKESNEVTVQNQSQSPSSSPGP